MAVSDAQIEREVLIDAPIEVVWSTITEPEQISQWFADRVELEVTPGGSGTFVFLDENGATRHTAPLVVETVEHPTRFAFRWNHPHGEQPAAGNSMLVEFTLASEGSESTRLRVVETGLELLSWPEADKHQYAEDHRDGWATFTARLVGLFTSRPVKHPTG